MESVEARKARRRALHCLQLIASQPSLPLTLLITHMCALHNKCHRGGADAIDWQLWVIGAVFIAAEPTKSKSTTYNCISI